jgi:CRISPR/Cas system-associated exonuclease Cas4 (RecB family)
MNTQYISGEMIGSFLQCPKRAWLESHGSVGASSSMAAEALMEQGKWVHAAGRAVFKDAVNVCSGLPAEQASEQTTALITEGKNVVNGCFKSRGLSVRVDVISQKSDGVEIVAVRSGSHVKDAYVTDCAMVMACAKESGVEVKSFKMMLPNTSIERQEGSDGSEVFGFHDVTEAVSIRAERVWHWVDRCAESLNGPMPMCEPGEHCTSARACPFQSQCGKVEVLQEIDLAKHLPKKTPAMKALMADGFIKMGDMPAEDLLIERNAVVYAAVVEGKGVVSRRVRDLIRSLPYPRSWIDFEACGFAIPRFTGMVPYQALPFQWSCHTKSEKGAEFEHKEFIDVSGDDPRRGFVESLIQAVGSSGPIMVFSAYERSRLKEIAIALPEFEEAIQAIISRLVDVLELARKGYYHPKMRGSWSLKKISPTLPECKELQAYSELGEVADGMAAQAAYLEQIDKDFIGVQKEIRLVMMLDYCEADTRGLAHLMESMECANVPISFGGGAYFSMV